MGPSKTFFLAVILGIIFITAEARLQARRLRQGEPCDTPGFFGDAEDCRKFYRCAEHPTDDENNPLLIRYTFRCGNGTVFDESLSTCNHPEAVMNKPENCVVHDPDEGDNTGGGNGMSMDNKNTGLSWGSTQPFLITNHVLVHQQPLTIPANQLLYTSSIPIIPYANLIQYG